MVATRSSDASAATSASHTHQVGIHESCRWAIDRDRRGLLADSARAGRARAPRAGRALPLPSDSPFTWSGAEGAGRGRVAQGRGWALGLEVETVDASFGEIGSLLRAAGPAVIRIGADAAVMLVRRRGRRLTVIGPDHREVAVRVETLRRALVDPEAAPLVADAERLADEAGVRAANRSAVASALVEERLRARRLRGVWLLRIPSGASFGAQVAAAGGRRRLVLLALAHAGQYRLWIAAWWLLGRAALQGRLDRVVARGVDARALHAGAVAACWRCGSRAGWRSRWALCSSNAF